MTRLSTEQILKDNKTGDPNSIKSLTLTHKALSDVSCLTDFNNLERLDLSSNNLTSLEGLRHCVNLKWLSVVQNKLQSLKGIEGLSKLTVLNACKNELRSMDEVISVVSLRALILNDNEIVSICKLDQMKELNTLVLSRNPIREIGDSLLNMKAITKLSLSNCQVQIIGSSLKSCTELKELRLAHNDIKVLKSLVSLNNLNLQGNPVAEYDKLAKKVKNLLPSLHIFNARPINRITKNEKDNIVDKVNDSSNNADDTIKVHMEKKRVGTRETNDKLSNEEIQWSKSDSAAGKKLKKKDVDMEKDLKRKGRKTSENLSNKGIQVHDDDKRFRKKQSKEKQGELDIIDNGETAFSELFSANIVGNLGFDGGNNMGLCSINFTTTRISPRKASSPEVPAHTDRSEYAGCFPGANPPTLKSDMKIWGTLATNLMAVRLPLSPSLPQFTPVVLPTLGCGCPIIFMMGEWRWTSCLDSRIGRHVSPTAVDRVSSPRTLARETHARRILPPNICSSRLVSPKYFPQTPVPQFLVLGNFWLGIWFRHMPWKILQCLRFCSHLRGRADPGMLGFCLAIKQALRLGEPLHALVTSSMLGDSARLHVVEQILMFSSKLEILLAFSWPSRFWHAWLLSRHKQALRLVEPLHALDPGMLGFCLAIQQALRLVEPLHALVTSSMLGDSASLLVAEQILACLASVRHKTGFETCRAFACLRRFITVSSD
ncbi:leucine-rich repeat and IQ domain-containing protein 1-related [Citrus sinensis]|nr:leucine-rich repeat and IQ domain-containing protein 1-related [Citrus sinensis]